MRQFPILILLCLLVTSCFEIHEEIWIESNDSGRATLQYTVPDAALLAIGGKEAIDAAAREIQASHPELRIDELLIESSNGQSRITAKASTDSLRSLIAHLKGDTLQNLPAAAKDLVGNIDFEIKDLDVHFQREINIKRALGLTSLAINSEERANRRILQIIHLPSATTHHNATRTEDAGRTLIWDHSLGEALKAPLSTAFVFRIPLPWWFVGSVIILATALAFGIVRFIRRKQMKTPN